MMARLADPVCLAAFALALSLGVWLGKKLEQWLALRCLKGNDLH